MRPIYILFSLILLFQTETWCQVSQLGPGRNFPILKPKVSRKKTESPIQKEKPFVATVPEGWSKIKIEGHPNIVAPSAISDDIFIFVDSTYKNYYSAQRDSFGAVWNAPEKLAEYHVNDSLLYGRGVYSENGERYYFAVTSLKKSSLEESMIYVSVYDNEKGKWGIPYTILDASIVPTDLNYITPFAYHDDEKDIDILLVAYGNREKPNFHQLARYEMEAGQDGKLFAKRNEANFLPLSVGTEDRIAPFFHKSSNTLFYCAKSITSNSTYDVYSYFAGKSEKVKGFSSPDYDETFYWIYESGKGGFVISDLEIDPKKRTNCTPGQAYEFKK